MTGRLEEEKQTQNVNEKTKGEKWYKMLSL